MKLYYQENYIVTLSIDNNIVTEPLSINSKKFPRLSEKYIFDENISNAEISWELYKAAVEWHETKNIGIINFWYKDYDEANIDDNGNIIL